MWAVREACGVGEGGEKMENLNQAYSGKKERGKGNTFREREPVCIVLKKSSEGKVMASPGRNRSMQIETRAGGDVAGHAG